jgi:S-adenosylmethionine synthetase
MVTTNRVVVAGEYKSDVDINKCESIARQVVKNIGYEQEGFHWENFSFDNYLHGQSPDIALGTDDFGAGDQGLMFGYATKETPNYMPLAISLSHEIVRSVVENLPFGPDAKAQVSVEYSDIGKPVRVSKVVCSVQHQDWQPIEAIRVIIEEYISAYLKDWVDSNTEYLINPTGKFIIGGPDGDAGLTGRKIIVDTYGGYCPHGGGAFSGKDCTKVDRSGAYMTRYLAKNIVAHKGVDNCTVQLSYAIGVKEPTSLYVYADGVVRPDLVEWIQQKVDLTPKGIIDHLDLFSLDLTQTTNYGHFGKDDLPWERLDLTD